MQQKGNYKEMKKGIFITLEGAEGSGKSSVAHLLDSYYKEHGFEVVLTKEPGGVEIAEQIRNVILNKENVKMDAYTELLLYIAARRQHLVEKVIPALNEGKIVICDRFIDSTYAYQGFGRGIDTSVIESLNAIAIDEKNYPIDLTLLLDVAPEIGLARIQNNGRETNRLDVEKLAFHEKVREGYKDVEQHYPHRIVNIDASADLTSTYLKAKTVIDKQLEKVLKTTNCEELKQRIENYLGVNTNSKKKIIVLVGPSGSGKTTVINMLNESGFPELVSHTTRAKRKEDIEGKNYFFVTEEEFAKHDFVETVTYSGNHYGLAREEIEHKLSLHHTVVIAAAIEGALAIKYQYPKETILVYLETSFETCKKRMMVRGDSEESIEKRLQNILEVKEFENGKYCDLIVNVDNLSPNEVLKKITSHLSNKKILVFIGTSGSGKTALVRGLNKDGIPVIVTHTTRPQRPNEFNGVDYHFVTVDEFMDIEKLEYAEYAGNYYGVSKKEIEDKLSKHDVIAAITSIEGGLAIRDEFPHYATLIFVDIDENLAIERMIKRGDNPEMIQKRIVHRALSNEDKNSELCDYVLDNNREFNETLSALKEFLDLISKEGKLEPYKPVKDIDILLNKKRVGA